MPGSLGERDAVSSPGHEVGRRRAIGVVAALPATSARPRRWCDAGPPGRQSVTASQKAGVKDRVRGSVRNQGQSSGSDRSRPGPAEIRVHRGAGFDIVPERPPGFAALPAQCHAGLPRGARCGLLFRPRGRPPALEQRGRSPSIHHPRDHAARATLVSWDALASQLTRRPGLRTGSVSAGDRTNPHRYTTIADGTSALQASQRPRRPWMRVPIPNQCQYW